MRFRAVTLSLAAASLLALPVLAAGPGPKNPELRAARRQLAAAQLVQQLDLSAEQKQALRDILTQARAQREQQQQQDPAVVKAHERQTALLATATQEVRASGEISSETRQALAALRGELGTLRAAHREQMKELKDAALEVLTPEQRQKLQSQRFGKRGMGPGARGMGGPGMGPGVGPEDGRGMGPGMGPGHHGRRGGGKAFGLLLSDELLAELSR